MEGPSRLITISRAQMSKIKAEIAVYQTARNTYVATLKDELEKQ